MNIKTCINNAGLATLWRLPPETAHNLAIWALHKGLVPAAGQANTVELKSGLFRTKPIPGLGSLPHPVCLAAGFDKNAETVRHLHNLEFAAAELGTVTPKPQEGNAKPRLFRLKEQRALINRMGFNNCGIDKFMQNLQKTARRDKMKIGVNVGKNKVTEQEKAVDDYIYCLDKTKDSADYFVVNISSPNTPGLRDLGTQSFLDELETQIEENQLKKTYIKVDPDRTKKDFTAIIERIAKKNFAGLVLSNTSTASTPEKGGLSGSPIISTRGYVRPRHTGENHAGSTGGSDLYRYGLSWVRGSGLTFT